VKRIVAAGIILGICGMIMSVFKPVKAALPPIDSIRDVIQLKPSNTPTPTLIKIQKIIDPNVFKIIATSTPTLPAKLTVTPTTAPTDTPTPKISLTPTPTASQLGGQATEKPVTGLAATITTQPTPVAQTGNNMTFWFLIITIGLLAVIIMVQAWPRKDKEE
jgi:hypothetical protein